MVSKYGELPIGAVGIAHCVKASDVRVHPGGSANSYPNCFEAIRVGVPVVIDPREEPSSPGRSSEFELVLVPEHAARTTPISTNANVTLHCRDVFSIMLTILWWLKAER
jgi:hypothetical protein